MMTAILNTQEQENQHRGQHIQAEYLPLKNINVTFQSKYNGIVKKIKNQLNSQG